MKGVKNWKEVLAEIVAIILFVIVYEILSHFLGFEGAVLVALSTIIVRITH